MMPIDAQIFGGGAADIQRTDPEIFKDVVTPTEEKKMSPSQMALEGMSPGQKILVGAGKFIADPIIRAKQLFRPLTPDEQNTVGYGREANRDPWVMGGNVLANMALAPLSGPSLIGNAIVGAGAGFMEPTLTGESGIGNAARGAAWGAGSAAVARLLTGAPIIKPPPQAQALLDEGIVPTLGQTASSSPSRIARSLAKKEEELQSIPLIGDFITSSRRRATEEFNRSALNRAMPPGQTVKNIGEEGISQAKQALSDAFENAYRGTSISMNPAFKQSLLTAVDAPMVPLSATNKEKFVAALKKNVFDRMKSSMDTSTAKLEIESALGKLERDYTPAYGKSISPDDKALGEAFGAAKQIFRDYMNQVVGPQNAATLSTLNKARANRVPIDRAVEAARAQGGMFTPFQLQSVAEPGTEMRNFANTAQAVLPTRVPNSFTFDRAMAGGALGMGTPLGAAFFFGAPYVGALSAAPLAYSRLGARHLQGALTPQIMQATDPYVAQAIRAYQMQQ